LLASAFGATGLVVALYALAWVAAGPGVARGTTVLGVPVGGMSAAEAARTLDRELTDEAKAKLRVRAGTREAGVAPRRAGLALDVQATVESAPSRSWNPLELVDAVLGGDEVEAVATVDRAALGAAVGRLAQRLDRPAVDGQVRLTKQAEVRRVEAQDGIRVRRSAAERALVAAYLSQAHAAGRPVRIPAAVDRPAVGQAEVDRVAIELAEPAVSAPVAVTVESTTVQLSPVAIARSLTFVPDGEGALQPRLDGGRLHAAIAGDLASVEEPAQDATFDVSSGRPRVVPSAQGREVLPETLAAAVLPVLRETGAGRAVSVPLEVSDPEVDTALAESLGVRELVAEYTTYYPSDFPPRLTNIHRAADLMDATLVLPGDVFSLNRTVGERTAERGFAAGFIINNGRLEVDYGGGVSQLATTTFNAAFFAGLEIVEHHPHSFYISRYPEGRESTVAWGYKDVRVRNDSEHGVFITTGYTDSSVTVRVWGTKRYRIEATKGPRYDVKPFTVEYDPRPEGTDQGDCVSTEGVPGFRVVVTRQFYENGQQVRSEEFRTKYDPENEVRCGSAGPAPPEGTQPD
jgi:vancomycin resistance protein YoaR